MPPAGGGCCGRSQDIFGHRGRQRLVRRGRRREITARLYRAQRGNAAHGFGDLFALAEDQ